MKTLDDWIKTYEAKTKDKFERKPSFELFFVPDRGFAEVATDGASLYVWQLCGDGHWWIERFLEACERFNLQRIVTVETRKNIRAYIRFWGFKIDAVVTADNGAKRFYCSQKNGSDTMIASTAWQNVDGTEAYAVTWEVRKKMEEPIKFDLQLFGGGKGSKQTTTVKYPDPTPNELHLQDLALGYADQSSPIASDILKQVQGLLQNNYGATSVDYGQLTNDAMGQIGQAQQGIAGLTQGQLPQAYTDNMTAAIQSGVDNTMGKTLTGLANNGVLNSSVTGSAMNDISKNVANTMAQQYNNNVQTLSGLYNQQAGTATGQLQAAAGGQQAALAAPGTLLGYSTGLQNAGVNTTLGQLAAARGGQQSSTTKQSGGGMGFLGGLAGSMILGGM